MRRLLLAATAVAALAACSSMHSVAPAASAEPAAQKVLQGLGFGAPG